MAEPDHIIVKPIPNLSRDGLGAAFPFFYIQPKQYESTLRKFYPEEKGPITNVDPIGNSPVIVGKVHTPTWFINKGGILFCFVFFFICNKQLFCVAFICSFL